MSFVPVVANPPAASSRAHELGDRLSGTIDRFRHDHPNVSPAEIRQGLRLATREIGAGGATFGVALGAIFLIFGGVTFLYFTRGALNFGGQPMILMAMIGAGIVALAIVTAALKNRS